MRGTHIFLTRSFSQTTLSQIASLYLLVIAGLLCLTSSASAFQSFHEFSQSRNNNHNVDVAASTVPATVKPDEDFDLHLEVKLSEGWHIYSLKPQSQDKTLATQIRFSESVFLAQTPWVEPEPVITLDGALDKVVKVHKDPVIRFRRNLVVPGHLKPGTYPILGHIEFRACDNKICALPRKIVFQTILRVQRTGNP
ncbi:MAG: hypothetical protein NPINA01_05310 [Nitrospinaceae bacterium]|nr:MAG: hypothetical protein NPINA01_05310 [Nitrospinaceae bacterium]